MAHTQIRQAHEYVVSTERACTCTLEIVKNVRDITFTPSAMVGSENWSPCGVLHKNLRSHDRQQILLVTYLLDTRFSKRKINLKGCKTQTKNTHQISPHNTCHKFLGGMYIPNALNQMMYTGHHEHMGSSCTDLSLEYNYKKWTNTTT